MTASGRAVFLGIRHEAAASSSAVEWTSLVIRPSAHPRPRPQRYRGYFPNFWKGGPPPLVARVARVASIVGYPAVVSATANGRRLSNAFGSVGMTVCAGSSVSRGPPLWPISVLKASATTSPLRDWRRFEGAG